MNRTVIIITLATTFLASSCAGGDDATTSYTMYRNSPLEQNVRVHWASFDAKEEGDYNRGNCTMAARILNANVVASAKAQGKEPFEGVGFWCEPGSFSEHGNVPTQFDAAFPATSDSPLSW